MSQVIGVIAERLADSLRVPAENREATVQTAKHIIEAELSRWMGGERFYVAKVGQQQRKAREDRIAAAIAAGEAPADIAKRESITPQHVRRIRGRIGG